MRTSWSGKGSPELLDEPLPLAIGPSVHEQDPVSLFLFSAAVSLPHRIHYDREFAQSEGHRDLLVHGPLQGAYAAELVARWARAHHGRIVHLAYRNVAPAYSGDRLSALGAVTSLVSTDDGGEVAHIELLVTNAGGETVTAGWAEVAMPLRVGEVDP